MAISFSDSLSISGAVPDLARQEYETLSEMKSVQAINMPDMYIGYCKTTHKFYIYNKANTEDKTLGLWRELSSQTTVMPLADETPVGTVYQYLGADTANYKKGYFYICEIASETTQIIDVLTISELLSLINSSGTTFKAKAGGARKVNKLVFTFNNVNYWNIDDVVYATENSEGDKDLDTPITTDEQVAAIDPVIQKQVTTYTYQWTNLPTSEGSSSDPIQVSELPEATAENLGTIYQYVGATDVDENLVNGYFYKCIVSGTVGGINQYGWTKIDVNSRNLTVISVDEINNLFN